MRALVDMNDAQVEALDHLAKRVRQSRAALIRAAIDDYLARHHRVQVENGFGLWGKGKVDGLAYQEKVRDEW
ncbi:ribbon-helix-helix domain-containing protein [Paracoccus denitrificans]|uniref:ribbon-helix-helix domain-containing protein n=1 Tax=Paracoccus denitrificans TaxID=266 RepID=UPI003364C39B